MNMYNLLFFEIQNTVNNSTTEPLAGFEVTEVCTYVLNSYIAKICTVHALHLMQIL